jgi:hypothetical protein
MTIRIDKGVPLPSGLSKSPNHDWPFHQLEVGDSFFIPYPDGDKAMRIRVSAAAQAAERNKRAAGKKFATRAVPGGARVWRVQ